MHSTFQQSCILCSENWQTISHLLSILFSFEQCNYTMSPITPVFVVSTMNNCKFCLRENPVVQESNINSKISWDTNNIPPNINFNHSICHNSYNVENSKMYNHKKYTCWNSTLHYFPYHFSLAYNHKGYRSILKILDITPYSWIMIITKNKK